MAVTARGIHIKGTGKKREGVKEFKEDFGERRPSRIGLCFHFSSVHLPSLVSFLELSTVSWIFLLIWIVKLEFEWVFISPIRKL